MMLTQPYPPPKFIRYKTELVRIRSTVFVIYSVERLRESRVCATVRPAARASFAEPFYRIYGGNSMCAIK